MQSLLIIGHPGHEICAYHFMHLYQPLIYCLTDGSSGSGIPRHQSCQQQLQKDGFKGYINLNSILEESLVYRSILSQDFDFFENNIIQPLKHYLRIVNPDIIVFDAYEGYNPIHDLTNFYVINAINSLENNFKNEDVSKSFLEIKLTDINYSSYRKFVNNSTQAFFGNNVSITKKIEYALFLKEYISDIPDNDEILKELSKKSETYSIADISNCTKKFMFFKEPFYEYHGNSRVEQGKFQENIQFSKHILPLINKIYN